MSIFPADSPAAPVPPERQETFGLSCWRGQAQAMTAFHRHQEIELNLILSGELSYLLGGQRLTLRAGGLAMLWAAMPHRVVATAADTQVFWLTLPLGQFLRWNLPPHLIRAALSGRAVPVQADSHDLARFQGWSELLGPASGNAVSGNAGSSHAVSGHPAASDEARRIVLLELEGRLRRLALRLPVSAAPQDALSLGQDGAGRAERMAAFVAAHYREDIRVPDVAAEVGLNPNYASSVFRSALGSSIARYVTQYRVAHAQRLLVSTDLAVLDVMYDAGFRSSSRFHEAFVEACGVSPRVYRQHSGAG